MSGTDEASVEHVFGKHYAACKIGDCGHVVRSTHSAVLAMKLDSHLQEEHDTTFEKELARYVDQDTDRGADE